MKLARTFAAAVMLLSLAACGNSPKPIPSDITDAVLNEVSFNSPSEKTLDDLGYYISVDTAEIEDLSYYICGSGGFPDELLIIKFKSADAANSSLEAAQNKLEEKTNTFVSYAPEEMYKLDNASARTKNEYLIFYALSDNDKAGEIIDGFFVK